MPNRILRDGILFSDAVNELGQAAENFYRRLMSVHDDWGRFDARSSVLRATCFPLRIDSIREADISRLLAEVQEAGLIALYEVDAKPYGLFLKTDKPRAESSKWPPPPSNLRHWAKGADGKPVFVEFDPLRAGEIICAQPRPYSNAYSDSNSNACSPKPPQAGAGTGEGAGPGNKGPPPESRGPRMPRPQAAARKQARNQDFVDGAIAGAKGVGR